MEGAQGFIAGASEGPERSGGIFSPCQCPYLEMITRPMKAPELPMHRADPSASPSAKPTRWPSDSKGPECGDC